MKFLLINVQGQVTFFSSRKEDISISPPLAPPLGLLYIAGILESAGHTVDIIEYYLEQNPVDVITRHLSQVDVVGMSVSSAWYQVAEDLARHIKYTDPTIPIIIGGPHCIFHPIDAFDHVPHADICVEGEAEHIILAIVKAIKHHVPPKNIPGVNYKTKNHHIHQGPPAQLIYDLDSLPFPSRHLVEKYEYGKISTAYFFRPKLTSLITSRGCPFRCRFCARNAACYNTYRQRSAENVVEEFQQLADHYRSIYVTDENFLTDVKRVHNILDSLIKERLDLDILIYGTRVDSAERILYKKMKKAGVKYLEFGLESGNQDTLDFYNKKITISQIQKAIQLAREMNFITTGHFTLGAPIETRQHIKKTIDFACSLPLDIVVFFPLYYMNGSDLWREAVENGFIHPTEDIYGIVADSRRNLGNFTKEELEHFCAQAAKRFYLRPSYLLHQFIWSLKRKNFNLLKVGLHIQ